MVKDYNSVEECQPIVRDCMKIAEKYDSSFWLVLHENPMVDKLVGTLGSIFQRKVAEIFTIRKVKQVDLKPNDRDAALPPIYFIVKQVKARGRDVDDWMFYYLLGAAGWGIPVELDAPDEPQDPVPTTTKQEERPSDEEVKEAVKVIGNETISFTTLRERIKQGSHCNSEKARYYVDIAVSVGYLIKDGNKYAASDELLQDRIRYEKDNDVPF